MSFTYPFSIPSGTTILPAVSGNNNIGSVALPINTIFASTINNPGVAKAWVVGSGTAGGVTIRAGYNVTSVAKNGTGDYTAFFTSGTFADTNIGVSAGAGVGSAYSTVNIQSANAITSTGVRFTTQTAASSNADAPYFFVSFYHL